jgi:hypothetical protein
MPWFRSPPSTLPTDARAPLSLDSIRRLAAEVTRPEHFFVAPNLHLDWDHAASEQGRWEVFQGHLLDPRHTRLEKTFEAWNVYQGSTAGRPEEPLLSLKLDAADRQLHVVRGLDSYVWEGYDSGGGVYLSREVRKWKRELVGTVLLDQFGTEQELRDELICLLFLALVGTSRLPLASVEAPLPAFSFGELFYSYRADALADGGFLHTYPELVHGMLSVALSAREQARWLETFLHAVPFPEMEGAVTLLLAHWSVLGGSPADLLALLRNMFNEASLSPYTNLVDKALAFLAVLEDRAYLAPADAVDFLGHLLRQVGRHLTGYDLVTFHHRGANYPDALLLDAVLKAYLARIDKHSELFHVAEADGAEVRRTKRLRRRALRQGWLLRRRHEGHPVPDLPTSPGENSRVLPPSHPRVPDEQITQPGRRTRRLYADDPLTAYLGASAAAVLKQSIADLEDPLELRELGTALFLDRPLGMRKAPAAPDATLLLTAEAFSRSVAGQRLHYLAHDLGLLDDTRHSALLGQLRRMNVTGLPLEAVGAGTRPGPVTLTDAWQAAPDFVFLRSTRNGVAGLLHQYHFGPLMEYCDLAYLTTGRVLVARSPDGPGVRIYDNRLRPRLELEVPEGTEYVRRAGQEYPDSGLRVVRVWDADGAEERLPSEPLVLRPRD